jgi:hypothetical protein
MSRVQLGVLAFVCLLGIGPVYADPPPWANGNAYANGRSVPIPSSDLLFGLGLAALAWLGPKIRKG